MKKRNIDNKIEEYVDFLSRYDFSHVIAGQGFREEFRAIYKKYYITLVWGAYVEQVYGSDNPGRIYFMEAVSDINQAVFLWCHGLYKSCNIVLRSFIENVHRAIAFWLQIPEAGTKDVKALLESLRSNAILRENTVYLYHFGRLRQRYVDLCGYVHSSASVYMADVHVIGIYPTYDPEKAAEARKTASELCVSVNAILCRVIGGVFREMHYRDRDMILDGLPRTFKKVLFSREKSG